MIAIIDTDNPTLYAELKAFLINKNIKTTWCEDEEDLEAKEDAALYQLMMEEPRELVDVDAFLQTLKNNINASRSH